MAYSGCKTQTHVGIDMQHAVATITLARPDKKNAISRQMLTGIRDFLKASSNDPLIRALVVRGHGGFFSSGADLEWMKEGKSQSVQHNMADAGLFFDTYNALNSYPKPVVAVVEKGAFGGAVGLVACADVAIATHDTLFALPEVRLGLIPATIAPFVSNKLGHSATRRFMLTGEIFSASEAQRLGLVHEVVENGKQDEHLQILVNKLMQNGPEAMASTKYLVNLLAEKQTDKSELTDFVTRLIASARASDEGQEGVQAFFDRRETNWQNASNPTNDQ
ncbi:MAG: enoyl-CoA hydratase-related protein [Breznakibacter sp.]